MKQAKLFLLGLIMLSAIVSQAQISNLDTMSRQAKSTEFKKKKGITVGFGTASYLGDLTEKAKPFNQSAFSFSAGFIYGFRRNMYIRAEFSAMRVRAEDSKNSDAKYKARNLSFKSGVYELSVAFEYDFMNIDKHKFTPYAFAGVGAFNFNPFTTDRNGIKRILQPLGTEGQGLPQYEAKYKRTAISLPIGGGFKYVANRNVTLQLDVKYRITMTDYLDDVSANRYPPKADLDSRDLLTATLTYRGDEVGSGGYPPASTNIPRGNPDKKDAFYTVQFKSQFNIGTNKKPRKRVKRPDEE